MNMHTFQHLLHEWASVRTNSHVNKQLADDFEVMGEILMGLYAKLRG
jgi:hypothetical protein